MNLGLSMSHRLNYEAAALTTRPPRPDVMYLYFSDVVIDNESLMFDSGHESNVIYVGSSGHPLNYSVSDNPQVSTCHFFELERCETGLMKH